MQILTGAPKECVRRIPHRFAVEVSERPFVAKSPEDKLTLSLPFEKGHYSGKKIAQRALTGALTGLGGYFFAGGDVFATAQIGAVIDGAVGAVSGGTGKSFLGGSVTVRGGGPLTGGGLGGGIGLISGGTKGAILAIAGNAFGGGPLAFAGVGALVGALGL